MMPFAPVAGGQAMRRAARNRARAWATIVDAQDEKRLGGPCYRPRLAPKFQIDRSRPIFAIGSCFAENIQYALADLGLRPSSMFIDAPDAPDDGRGWFGTLLPDKSRLFYAPAFLHRYNLPSMLQEVERLLTPDTAMDEDALLIAMSNGEVRDFHYHEHYPLDSIDDSIERRRYIQRRFQSVRDCGLFVMTLGLIEAWRDRATGLFLNTTPPFAAIVAEPERYEFVVMDWPTLAQVGRKLIGLVKQHVPDVKVLITVSPVPLDVTFTGADVGVATMHAKSTLVSVARELASDDPDVDYFPSYEMVMLSDRSEVWAEDQRHVQGTFVARIMKHFAESYIGVEETSTNAAAAE